MWFWFSILALLCWSGSDLFSKIGCRDESDKYSHLKMLAAVGFVMGLHALWSLLFGGVTITGKTVLTYLPVSALYILSMAVGYLGLRYIELSISSPICNSSGAIVAVLAILTVGVTADTPPVAFAAIALISLGVIFLGIVEAREDDELRAARQDKANRRYTKSVFAILLPVIYCLLDALGTFADSLVLQKLDEEAANCAYELTFLTVGLVSFVYVVCVKKQKLLPEQELPKYGGAVFETVGQFFYILALADTEHVAFAAPIISSYCIVSVLWSSAFLRERLSKKHYAALALVIVGIVILGVLDI